MKARQLPCFGPNCRAKRVPWRHFCDTCWSAIPGWLRRYIAQEKEACRLVKTAHSDRLLQLRDMAIKELAKPPEEKKAS